MDVLELCKLKSEVLIRGRFRTVYAKILVSLN